MAVTWADVVALDPELATIPTATQTAILEAVKIMIHACPWGSKYDLAVKLLAAHFGKLWLLKAGGAGGPVLKEKVGQIERSYGNIFSTSGKALDQTMWGQWYQMLLNGLLGARGPLVT